MRQEKAKVETMSNISQTQVIEQWLKELCVNIGERPVGTPNNRKAQSYIGAIFQQHGYDVEYQEFDCVDWKGHAVSLYVGNQPVPAAISPYSLPCDVTTEYETIGNVAQLEECDVRGKIAVLHGDLTKEAIMPKNFRFWNPEEHQHIVRLLEAKRPTALITVSFSDELPIPIIEDGDFRIPCAVVSRKSGLSLLAHPSAPLSLKIASTRQNAKGANVIARTRRNFDQKKIVFTAHMDTKPGTPGALDNASGVVTLLILSQLVRAKHLNSGFEFVVLNGEDYYSSAGEIAYLEQYQSEFPGILLNINCDGVGLKGSKIGVSYLGCPDSLFACCEQVRQNNSIVEVIAPWYQGDHMIFVAQQVPALTVTSSDVFPLVDTLVHTEKDTLDLLDSKSILHAAEFLVGLIDGCNMMGQTIPPTLRS
jgi:aminopeptidase YwaD